MYKFTKKCVFWCFFSNRANEFYPKLVNVLYNTIFGCLSKMVAQFPYVINSLFLEWIIQSLLLLASAIYYALAIQLL